MAYFLSFCQDPIEKDLLIMSVEGPGIKLHIHFFHCLYISVNTVNENLFEFFNDYKYIFFLYILFIYLFVHFETLFLDTVSLKFFG